MWTSKFRITRFWIGLLPFCLLLTFVGPLPQVVAQQKDIGEQIEQEYGVVARGAPEGQRLNDQLDATVERIVRGINEEYGKHNFKLRSAKILGGRSAEKDKVVNAFALPDGRIYVTLGLMRLIQDKPLRDDELAFVVGHEVTHVVEQHSAKQQKRSLPYLLGAVILGAVTNNQAVGTAVGLGAQAKVASFSREDEYRADRGGLLGMYRAGFNLEGAPAMLKLLKGPDKEDKFMNGIFGSHPITDNRIKRAEEMIQDLRAKGSLPDREKKKR